MAITPYILEAIGAILCLVISLKHLHGKILATTYIYSMSIGILLVVIGMLMP